MLPGLKLVPIGSLFSDPALYRKLVGKLLYLSLTRSDICYSVQQLNQFVTTPIEEHFKVSLYLLKYLQHIITFGLFDPKQQNISFIGFSDVDQTSCIYTRRSFYGFCMEDQEVAHCLKILYRIRVQKHDIHYCRIVMVGLSTSRLAGSCFLPNHLVL